MNDLINSSYIHVLRILILFYNEYKTSQNLSGIIITVGNGIIRIHFYGYIFKQLRLFTSLGICWFSQRSINYIYLNIVAALYRAYQHRLYVISGPILIYERFFVETS